MNRVRPNSSEGGSLLRGFKWLSMVTLVAFGLIVSGRGASTPSRTVQYVNGAVDKRLAANVKQLAHDGKTAEIAVILAKEGYLNGNVSVSGDTIYIDPGPSFQLGMIDLTVIDSAGESTGKKISDYRHWQATEADFGRIRNDLLRAYQEQGYFFASVNTDRVEIQGELVMPVLRLITGPLVTIQRVRFKGLTRSRPEYVAGLSGLRPGYPLVRERLHDAIAKIESEGYLRVDSLSELAPSENYREAEVLFNLTESKSTSFELGGGYLPGQGLRKGEFIGHVNLESKNLFGTGRKFAVLFDRKDGASSHTEFRFVQPLFIPDHLEASVHVRQIDYDSSYNLFSAEGSVTVVTRGNTRLTGGVSWAKTEPQRSSQPPSRTVAGTLGYEATAFDDAANPSRGRRMKIGAAYLRRTSRPDTSATTTSKDESTYELAVESYLHLGGPLVIRANVESKIRITSRDLIDYSEEFKLGGLGSLRGYRQDEFAGRRTVLGQAELRFRPSPALAAYLFGDVGYIYGKRLTAPGIVLAEETTRVGSGIGLFVGSPSARVTLELGWGRHDRIDDGKIHLGLVTLF